MKFNAKIHKIGINPVVDVPESVVRRLLRDADKKNAPVQVTGTINGKTTFKNTVIKYRGAYRLPLNTQMRDEADVSVGDVVSFIISFDPKPRILPVPKELKTTLKKNKKAKEKWEKLPPSHRKEFLAYLNSLKTKESLKRNVDKIVKILLK